MRASGYLIGWCAGGRRRRIDSKANQIFDDQRKACDHQLRISVAAGADSDGQVIASVKKAPNSSWGSPRKHV